MNVSLKESSVLVDFAGAPRAIKPNWLPQMDHLLQLHHLHNFASATYSYYSEIMMTVPPVESLLESTVVLAVISIFQSRVAHVFGCCVSCSSIQV